MKFNIKYLALPLIVLASCNQSKPQPEQKPIPQPTQVAATEIKVDINSLATINDTTCGMPLSAGISDTTTVNGKLYGFCSSGCKESFLALQTKK